MGIEIWILYSLYKPWKFLFSPSHLNVNMILSLWVVQKQALDLQIHHSWRVLLFFLLLVFLVDRDNPDR